jgi:hypothetical protein
MALPCRDQCEVRRFAAAKRPSGAERASATGRNFVITINL